MKIKLITLSLLLFCQFSVANGVRGNPNCAKWLQPDDAFSELANKAWLIGYLSGVNIGLATDERRKPFDYFENVTNEQLFLWMSNYCRTKPLSSVMQGASDLYREIGKK